MIGSASTQLTHLVRQYSKLTLRRSIGTTIASAGNHGPSGSNSLLMTRNSLGVNCNALDNIMTSATTTKTTTTKCRFLSSSAGDGSNGTNNGSSGEDKKEGTTAGNDVTSMADKEWQQFNESMMFTDEQDGEGNTRFTGNKKVRGGKLVRKREMKMQLRAQALNPSSSTTTQRVEVGGGRFPSLRYSDEETQALLDESHANIPKRTGARRARHKKRQRNRKEVIYAYHRQRKEERIEKHFRTMEERSRIRGEVKDVMGSAEGMMEEEKGYRMEVLREYAEMFHLGPSEGGGGGEAVEVNEVGRENKLSAEL